MAYGTLTCDTTTWVTPSSMPPSSVPHSEPRPPMMTASNAKISVSAPSVGYTPVVTAFSVPASAAAAMAIPVTDANNGHHRGGQVGTAHREVTVGQVDQPHHAEHQRQADRGQRVRATQEDALHDVVEPGHARTAGPELGGPELGGPALGGPAGAPK